MFPTFMEPEGLLPAGKSLPLNPVLLGIFFNPEVGGSVFL
jgi:hypothetical protein